MDLSGLAAWAAWGVEETNRQSSYDPAKHNISVRIVVDVLKHGADKQLMVSRRRPIFVGRRRPMWKSADSMMMMMMTWTTCKAQCVDQSTSKAQINIVQVYTISGKNVFLI